MLTVCTWLWGDKYGPEYVKRLRAGVVRHLSAPYRFIVVGPEPEDMHLTAGCLVRLRMFEPAWQLRHGIEAGGRIVCMDLDSIVVGSLDPLFDRSDPFLILLNANVSNPNIYNGSVWSFIAGYRPDVWSDFSLEAARAVPFDAFPDDQAWLAHKLPGATGWECGAASGIWAFGKRTWPKGDALPEGARIVAFPGWRDPSKFTHLSWVQEYWR